jgi:hypothetical protein
MILSSQHSPSTVLEVEASHLQAQRSDQQSDRDLLVLVEIEDHVHLAKGHLGVRDLKHEWQNKSGSSLRHISHLLPLLQERCMVLAILE